PRAEGWRHGVRAAPGAEEIDHHSDDPQATLFSSAATAAPPPGRLLSTPSPGSTASGNDATEAGEKEDPWGASGFARAGRGGAEVGGEWEAREFAGRCSESRGGRERRSRAGKRRMETDYSHVELSSNTEIEDSAFQDFERTDVKDMRLEAEAVVNDVLFAVSNMFVSKSLPCSDDVAYINVETRERNKYCLELSEAGLRVTHSSF
uniref:GSKIP domain-containing protein n=1 Tax=Sarcophilus harrisii TaxID=9305 RepID=A0A7N4V1D3_SARHA